MYSTLTNGPVQRLTGLFVPHQSGLSLIGHTHRCEKSNILNITKTPPHMVDRCGNTPLMLEMLILSWTSFSQVLSIHS